MTVRSNSVQERARRRYAQIERKRRDPRYRRVLGRLVAARLLHTREPVALHSATISVADALWAGQVEPRILELLPAIVLKKPSFFSDASALPADLAHVVRALKRHHAAPDFRGIAGADIERWVPRVGHRGKTPSLLKSFRFSPEDTELLARVAGELGTTETDVLRRGLRELAAKLLESDRSEP